MFTPPVLMAAAVGLVLGVVVGLRVALSRTKALQEIEKAESRDEASRILTRAQEEADHALKAGELAGREEGFRLRDAWETEEGRRREDMERSERRLDERSDAVDRQVERLGFRESELEQRSEEVEQNAAAVSLREAEAAQASARTRERLEQVAGLSADEAKQELIEGLEVEARADAANSLREIKEQA